jgi:hypothetical protein
VNVAAIMPKSYYNYYITRPGNVLSTNINEKSLEMLENTKNVYLELAKRGYPEVGIRRILISINEIITKIPHEKVKQSSYNKYISACERLAAIPSEYELSMFFKKHKMSIKRSFSCWLVFHYFHFWLALKK